MRQLGARSHAIAVSSVTGALRKIHLISNAAGPGVLARQRSQGQLLTAHNRLVGGSSPPGPTNLFNGLMRERTAMPVTGQWLGQ